LNDRDRGRDSLRCRYKCNCRAMLRLRLMDKLVKNRIIIITIMFIITNTCSSHNHLFNTPRCYKILSH
jgi:hypothetical protein